MTHLPTKYRDPIMVAKTMLLYREFPFEGYLPSLWYDFCARVIKIHERIERSLVEEDATYQQIIPYVLIYHPTHDAYLITQRPVDHSDHTFAEGQHFAWQWSIGIWGHITKDLDQHYQDSTYLDSFARDIIAWELDLSDVWSLKVIWYINDNSHAVERVHFGIVMQALIHTTDITPNPTKISTHQRIPRKDLPKFFHDQWNNIDKRTSNLLTMIEHGEI